MGFGDWSPDVICSILGTGLGGTGECCELAVREEARGLLLPTAISAPISASAKSNRRVIGSASVAGNWRCAKATTYAASNKAAMADTGPARIPWCCCDDRLICRACRISVTWLRYYGAMLRKAPPLEAIEIFVAEIGIASCRERVCQYV